MQSLNDHNDELFRRAAEDYPLDTGMPDWDKVAAALAEDPVPPPRNSVSLSWLVLLIPLTLMCNRFLQDGRPDYHPFNSNKVAPVRTPQPAASASPSGKSSDLSTINASSDVSEPSSIHAKTLSGDNNEKDVVSRNPSRIQQNRIRINEGTYSAINSAGSKLSKTKSPAVSHTGSEDLLSGPGNATVTESTVPSLRRIPAEANLALLRLWPRAPVARPLPDEKKMSTPAPAVRKVDKGWYAGIVAGLDATTIKYQEIRRTGRDVGLIAGYRFSQKLSVETGVIANHKYYYSDGKYYDTKGLYMPANSSITDISGNCTMYEMPLIVGYRFSSSSRRGWEAHAGVSSYFMTNEQYRYTYYYATSAASAVHEKFYHPNSLTPFAVAQFSAGYYTSIGRSTAVRIEPYAKLPLKKLGSGSLPMTSTGLRLTLLKNFR